MASKRNLKRDVVKLAIELYDEALLLHSLSTEETAEKLAELMDNIAVFTDDTLRRIQNPDGKDNPKLIKSYYRKLREDITQKEDEFNNRLTSLLEEV